MMSPNEFHILARLGIRVIEIASLGVPSVWVDPVRLLIVDAGLDDRQREAVACRALSRLDWQHGAA